MNASPRQLASAFAGLIWVCLFGFASPAPAAFPEAPLLEQERVQTRIQDSTRRAGEQLDVVIDEFERNGLTGGDLDVLKAIRGVLDGLSETQMAEIVSMLGEAGAKPAAEEAGSKVFGAFSGQKSVIVQLRRILLEYRTQVALFELARRVRELGDRQTTNLHEAISLASDKEFDTKDLSSTHKVALQLQHTEQEALRDEVSMVVEKLTEIANLTSGSPDPRATQAVAFCAERKLSDELERAAEELKKKRVLSAVSLEKGSRDTLWALARILEPEQSTLERLVEALDQLDKRIAEQVEIAEESREAKQSDAAELAKRQGVLTDRNDFLARGLADVAEEAAAALAEAIDPMQEARSKLNEEQPADAVPATEAALEKMAEAREHLIEKIAAEQPVAEQPDDRLAALQELLKDVTAIREGQQQLKSETAPLAEAGASEALQEKSADQAELEASTAEASSAAVEQSLPEAASALDEAMAAMAEAGAELAGGEDAPQEQDQAIAKLAEAEQAIGAEVEKLKATAANLASIEELMEKLAPMIEEQTALGEGSEAAEAQAALGEESAALAEQAAGASEQASQNLQAAAANQAAASEQMSAQQSAKARQEAALDQLNAAQSELAKQASEFAEELGREEMEMPDMAALADLAEAISEAQEQVATAQETLGGAEAPDDFGQAAEPLGDAAEAISPFTSDPDKPLPAGVIESLLTADTAIDDASEAATEGEGDPARTNAGLAADSLAQAAAAVALAQAGLGGEMAQAESEGEGQSESAGEQASKGEKPGQGKGKQPGDPSGDAPPSDQGTGDQGNYASGSDNNGPRRNERGTSRFIGLPERERGTLTQSKADAYPAEYGSMIEQYLKNLSDKAGDTP